MHQGVTSMDRLRIDSTVVAVVDMPLHRLDRLMGTSARTEPVAVIREGRLQHRAQRLVKCLLDQAILHRRNTQYPFPPPCGLGILTRRIG